MRETLLSFFSCVFPLLRERWLWKTESHRDPEALCKRADEAVARRGGAKGRSASGNRSDSLAVGPLYSLSDTNGFATWLSITDIPQNKKQKQKK